MPNLKNLNRNQIIAIVVGGLVIGLVMRSRIKARDAEPDTATGDQNYEDVSAEASPQDYAATSDGVASVSSAYGDYLSAYAAYISANTPEVGVTTAQDNAAVEPPPAPAVPSIIPTGAISASMFAGMGGGAPNGRTAAAHVPTKYVPLKSQKRASALSHSPSLKRAIKKSQPKRKPKRSRGAHGGSG